VEVLGRAHNISPPPPLYSYTQGSGVWGFIVALTSAHSPARFIMKPDNDKANFKLLHAL
jgi:hypothetical protein